MLGLKSKGIVKWPGCPLWELCEWRRYQCKDECYESANNPLDCDKYFHLFCLPWDLLWPVEVLIKRIHYDKPIEILIKNKKDYLSK